MNRKKGTYQQRSGFKTPDNYFEGFEASLFNNLKYKPTKIASGFKVPENYFEGFNLETPKKETKVISLTQRNILLKIASVAAVLVFIVIAFNQFTKNNIRTTTIDHQAIEAYIDNNDIDFSTLDFSYYFNNDNESIKAELNTIDKQSILNYLTENAEVTTLLND